MLGTFGRNLFNTDCIEKLNDLRLAEVLPDWVARTIATASWHRLNVFLNWGKLIFSVPIVLMLLCLVACKTEDASARFILGRWYAYTIADQPIEKSTLINHSLEFDPNGELRVFSRTRRYPEEIIRRVGRWQIKDKGTLFIKLDEQVYKTPVQRVEFRLHLKHDTTLPHDDNTPPPIETQAPSVFYVR